MSSSADRRLTRAHELHRAGRVLEAKRMCEEIVAHDPLRHEAWAHLGRLLIQEEHYEQAVSSLSRAVSIAPAVAEYHANLGLAHGRAGRLEAAAGSMAQAAALEPHRAEAHYNLALVLGTLGSPYALAAFERASRLAPQNAQIRRAFAAALTRAGSVALVEGRLDEAEDFFRNALEHDSGSVPARFNLASALVQLGRTEESSATLRGLLELRPDEASARSNLLVVMNWSQSSDEDILREAIEFGSRHGPSRAHRTHANSRDPERRLRVGYFSADFSTLTPFLPVLFEAHDGAAFEFTCYSGAPSQDADVGRMRRHVHRWQEVSGLSDAALVDAIRTDQIDVLVDLTMHMAGSRLPAFADKPAPVQIAWLAYPGTTGIAAMDYRLTDPHLDPPGAPRHPYTEHSLHLPDSFWIYGDRLSDCEPGPLPATQNGFVTFGCLNSFAKTHDALVGLWSAVLRQVDDSRFILRAPSGKSRDRMLQAFERHGIAAARIEFVSQIPLREYLETYRRIDIGLDTFPYHGHTTSLDAAWMGVPTISRIGDKVVGRGGLSIARNLGLPGLAAEDDAGFVSTATDLANERPRLVTLRETLRARLRASPIMNAAEFARNLERAYRTAFRRWCEAATEGRTLSSDGRSASTCPERRR
jgi:protein O-GlcNAc transferase